MLCPGGSIVLVTKMRLGMFQPEANTGGPVPPPESSIFDPGNRNPLVEVGVITAAVGRCADVTHPSIPKEAADRGAGIYLASMFITPDEVERDAARLSGYAGRYSMVVSMANYDGPTGGLPGGGGSTICSQTGELLVRLEGKGVGIALATENAVDWQTKPIMLYPSYLKDGLIHSGK